jgi:hypothetical protein
MGQETFRVSFMREVCNMEKFQDLSHGRGDMKQENFKVFLMGVAGEVYYSKKFWVHFHRRRRCGI